MNAHRTAGRWCLSIGLVVLMASVCQACPTCKAAVADGGNHAGLVQGYFWSILFMMSMPFLILGGLGSYFYLQIVRARALHGLATRAASATVTSSQT